MSQPEKPEEKKLTEEERKKKIQELRKRLLDLRLRVEKWGMLKISDVSELNAVYRELGEIARELAKLNPDPEAVNMKSDAEKLARAVKAAYAITERLVPAGYADSISLEGTWLKIVVKPVNIEAVKSVLSEFNARISSQWRRMDGRLVLMVDVSEASVPEAGAAPPKAGAVDRYEEELARLESTVRSIVTEWANLYAPRRREEIVGRAERLLSERRSEILSLLRAGRSPDSEEVMSIVNEILADVARVVVSINRRALEHPDISRLLGAAPPPPTRAARMEEVFAPRAVSRLMAFRESENPYVRAFPPLGRRMGNMVELEPSAVGFLCKFGEIYGIRVEAKPDWTVDELASILSRLEDMFRARGNKDGLEWIRLFRRIVGI